MTWRWLIEGVVIAMHDEQIAEHFLAKTMPV
jgi:hypothetical protein